MTILILGITGMLGSTLFKYFSETGMNVFGTSRSSCLHKIFPDSLHKKIITNVDVKNFHTIQQAYSQTCPTTVINCIGAIKQINQGNSPLEAIPVNSLLPHLLADLCKVGKSRLIHFSTDCVFSGKKGNYTEQDIPDATDIYGRSKLLGELEYSPALTLRTSIIGHELCSNKSLLSWFLSQKEAVKGYRKAVFSGLPVIEIANIIKKIITDSPNLTGLYHVSATAVSKYDLLNIIKKVYNKKIDIIPSDEVIIDRSLDSSVFRDITGYQPPNWEKLIKKMYDFEQNSRTKCFPIK